MRWRPALLSLVLSLALAGAAGDGAPPVPTGGGGDSYESYRILSTRNIFMRDRSRARPTRPTYTRPTRESTVRGSLMLTGIAQGGDQWEAFLEEPGTGRTMRVLAGEDLGGGRVVSVTLEGMEYTRDGVTRRITIGDNVTGAGSAMPAAAAVQASATPTTGPATSGTAQGSGDPDTMSILERLRLRRLQETK